MKQNEFAFLSLEDLITKEKKLKVALSINCAGGGAYHSLYLHNYSRGLQFSTIFPHGFL